MASDTLNQHQQVRVAIIGRGKVGTGLHAAFTQGKIDSQLIGRNKAAQAEAAQTSNVIILCVPDAEIARVSEELTPHLVTGSVITHCSGALGSQELGHIKNKGCVIASTHPLNTFPTVDASINLLSKPDHNTALYAEGDHEALCVLNPLFEAIGFTINTIDSNAKVAYHTACVFACNYLTALADLSLNTAESADIDRESFWQSLQPLINTTLSNISKHGTVNALSGPIARGDIDTVHSHMQYLDSTSQSSKLNYLQLGKHALELSSQRGELSQSKLSRLKELLDD